MDPRRVAVAIGCGLTAFLFVAVGVIEALEVAFSAIVGLPVGTLAGAVVAAVLLRRYGRLGGNARGIAAAGAAFGYAVLAGLGLRYVNAPGARALLSQSRIVGLAAVAALGTYAWLRSRDRAHR